ncbi:unnamed protein product [Cunninghamella blakesleeana]
MSPNNNKRKQPTAVEEFSTLLSRISVDLATLAKLVNSNNAQDILTIGAGSNAPKKQKKDPNAPKPNLTSYIHYSREIRHKVEKENPDLTPNAVVAEVAKKWNSLSDSQKQKYKDIAAKDKIRYDKEMDAYNKKLATEKDTPSTSTAKKVNEKKPAAATNKKSVPSKNNKSKDEEEEEEDDDEHYEDATSKNKKDDESSDDSSSDDSSDEESD